MPLASPPRDRKGFEIAVICALPLEADYVQGVFDKFWDDEGLEYGKAPGDFNSYTTGLIGRHNVVLAYMPSRGTTTASAVAACLQASFPNIKLAWLVGICGGVPYTTSGEEIFLGDIIISDAVIQYDFGLQYPQSLKRKNTLGESLGRPNLEIRSFLARTQAYRYRQKLQEGVTTYLQDLLKLRNAQYPGVAADKLYNSTHLHKHDESHECDECRDKKQTCQAALSMTCLETGCKDTELARTRLMDGQDSVHTPAIHFGRIGSGDMVMKSGVQRDSFAKVDSIIGFEMEGAGVFDHFPCLIIKGVCDYADSHKNKMWVNYSAATAAACLKALLKDLNPKDQGAEQG
jgi:nucleoside phosphorylase